MVPTSGRNREETRTDANSNFLNAEDAESQILKRPKTPRHTDTQVTHETFGNVLTDLLPDIKELVPLEGHEANGCMFPLARIARTIE